MAVLYRKWRPQSLAEVVGQPVITRTLLNALGAGKIAHAYLFSGPRGTGKTSTGRILAKAVNCLSGGRGEPCNRCVICQDITLGRSLDVIEVDAASNRGIDEIRQLREKVGFAPSQGRYKVYIIDEVHMLTEAAANALLKTLEEPPAHVIFVLATTESHKVLPTIMSRCQHFAFRRLPIEAIASRLEHIAAGEGITLATGVSRLLARGAFGSLRDAENIMEQALNLYEQPLGLEQVRELLGLGVDIRAREVVRHILARQAAAALDALSQVVADGLDLRAFHRHILEYLRGLLLVKAGSAEAVEATLDEVAEMKAAAAGAELPLLLRLTHLFAAVDPRWDGYSPLPLELALMEGVGEEAKAEVKEVKETGLQAEPVALVGQGKVGQLPETPSVVEKVTKGEEGSPPPVVAPQARAITVEMSFAAVKQQWREFVDSLRGKGSRRDLDARLRAACEPVRLDGEVLELVFRYLSHYETVSDPKYIHLVEQGLKEFFGHPLKLKLTPPTERPVNQDPLVQAALERGARIIR